MLTKKDIIKILKELNFPLTDYWVTSGAALVLHGIKETTKDIDLGCTSYLFEKLIEQGYKFKVEDDKTRSLVYNSTIEIFENWWVDEINLLDDIPVGSLESIKKQKMQLGREKDLKDIILIDRFLKINN